MTNTISKDRPSKKEGRTPEEKIELLKKREENLTQRLDTMASQESKLKERLQTISNEIHALEPQEEAPPSPKNNHQLDRLRKQQENLVRCLSMMAEKEDKPQKMIDNETKLQQRLEVVSNKIQALESQKEPCLPSSPSPSSSSPPPSSPFPKNNQQLQRLRKQQENLVRRLSVMAEKEDKPQKMIDNETKLQQRLEIVSNKIQALEPQEESCLPSSPSPSPSSPSPKTSQQLERLRKQQQNIVRRLNALAEKENKSQKMIDNETKLNQRLQVVSNKIQALESLEEPCLPSSSSPSPSSPSDLQIERLKKRQESLTHRLDVMPQKMNDNEAKLKQRLEFISNKIQALEGRSPSSVTEW